LIAHVVRISWLNLRRDKVALALTFVLPIAFFSIFALVFGAVDKGATEPLRAALVVEDESRWSGRYREFLSEQKSLALITADQSGRDLDRASAIELVRRGSVEAAVVIPAGFSEAVLQRTRGETAIDLYTDSANPLAEPLATGMLQAGILQLGSELLAETMPTSIGWLSTLQQADASRGPLQIRIASLPGREGNLSSVAFFAAGIGVMFLLFTVTGRSSILIEERESGVLVRLLASRLTLGQLLLGRWVYLVTLGALQVTLMFVWGSLAFGLELWTPQRLLGFLVMCSTTAAAAAALGLLLATICRSRAQLNGISAVLVLVMSAVGGSMFPRFLMPEQMQRIGLLTFNAWALDGFQKVFWYQAGALELWPQVLVLLALTLSFLLLARRFAYRWRRY
jgi:ABC-2 type transport system permease protein